MSTGNDVVLGGVSVATERRRIAAEVRELGSGLERKREEIQRSLRDLENVRRNMDEEG